VTSCSWSEGRSHLEAEALLVFRRSMEAANLPTFVNYDPGWTDGRTDDNPHVTTARPLLKYGRLKINAHG